MAQYDLMLTQNIHATLVEFTEKFVNIGKGALLSGASTGAPTVLAAAGADNYMLVSEAAQTTGMKWQLSHDHAQNTDIGTSETVFHLGLGGNANELTSESASKVGIKVSGGLTYADLQAKDATFNKVTVGSAAPTGAYELTHKTYVDSLLSANDAMVFKGSIAPTGGAYTATTFNAFVGPYSAGWTYKVNGLGSDSNGPIKATIKGIVCEDGDVIMAIADQAATSGTNADWTAWQGNTDGQVTGPVGGSVADAEIAVFNGITGKVLKGSGKTLAALATDIATAVSNHAAVKTGIHGLVFSGTGALTMTKAVTLTGASDDSSVLVLETGSHTLASGAYAAALVKGTGSEIDAGTVDTTYVTPKAIKDSKQVSGPGTGNSVADHIATFLDTTGKVVKDSGKTLADLMTTWVAFPAYKTANGTVGQAAYDTVTGNYLAICTATNTWKRVCLATNW